MKIKFADKKLTSLKSDVLTFAYDLEHVKEAENVLTRFAPKLLKQHKKQQEFSKEVGKSLMIISEKPPVQYCYTEVISTENTSMNAMRTWGAHARTRAEQVHAQNVALYAETWMTDSLAQAWLEGFLLCGYRYNQYKSKPQKVTVKEIVVHTDATTKTAIQKGFAGARQVVLGVTAARDLVNTPAHDMTPTVLAEKALQIAAESNERIQVTIYEEAECEEMGMGSYLAVAKGSQEPPKFIHLIYKPGETERRIAVIGKGVTFDSGGLSLKPAQSMETMKCDMAGAATVLGLFATLAKSNLNIEVHGIIAATENMPSGHAIRPGDIVKASNGTTIEILNTDAEGRLTLADALIFAEKFNPEAIIDLATLTGACVVGLGEEIAAMYSNSDQLSEALLANAHEAGEGLWRMPLHSPYDKLIDSKFADIRNIATTPYGGSITAALFLQRFVKKGQAWAHLDIAGPAYAEKPLNAYTHHGASGYGVATLLQYIQTLTASVE